MSASVETAPRAAAAARELTWIEGLRLVRSPIVLAGALLSSVFAVTFTRENQFGGAYFVLSGAMVLPLAFAALIAANLAALRSERSDTGELYGSLASPAGVRTVAHLAAVGWVALGSAALVAMGVIVTGAWEGLEITPEGRAATPSLFELAQGPVAVATLGVVGVALARWLPYLPVAPVVGVGVLAAEVPFAMWNFQAGYVWLAPVVNPARVGTGSSWPCFADQTWPCLFDRFAVSGIAWHLLYLGGLILAFSALALLRDNSLRRPKLLALAAAGLVVAAVAGVLQLP